MHNYKQLKVWNKSVELATRKFPKNELYGITSKSAGVLFQSAPILLKEPDVPEKRSLNTS